MLSPSRRLHQRKESTLMLATSYSRSAKSQIAILMQKGFGLMKAKLKLSFMNQALLSTPTLVMSLFVFLEYFSKYSQCSFYQLAIPLLEHFQRQYFCMDWFRYIS